MSAIARQMDANSWKGTALLLFLVVTGLTACRRTGPDPMAHGWQRVRVEPLGGAIILQEGQESNCIWYVDKESQKVRVSRASNAVYKRAREVRLPTADGTLVGTDNGEWGGSLSLLDAKGNPPRQILDKNVLQIFQVKSAFWVITGGLDANEGSVWLYSNMNGRGWTIEKRTQLNMYPVVVQKGKGGILLVGNDGVYRVDDFFRVRQLADLPLLGLGPNSVAEDDRGAIYIGMNAFVVRLVPDHTGYAHEWFVGDGCLP